MVDLLKLLLILALTIFLLLKKWELGVVLLLNTGLVALLFAYPLAAWGRSVLGALVAADTLDLAGAVFLVLVLAEVMRRTNAMEQMVTALQVLVPDGRITVALMPLMIGLMPMLGGAMFSAPMVNEVGNPLGLSADRKTFINYWFRHAMEYVFPLYSSLLMMAALMGVSVFDFIGASWPLTFAALLGGVIWGLAGIGAPAHPPESTVGAMAAGTLRPALTVRQAWLTLLRSTWPILLVILTVVVLKLPMVLSLIGVIALLVAVKRVPPREWWAVLKRSFPPSTFLAIVGVMVFKHVMEDAGAVNSIPQALSTLGLPALLVAFAVPMVVGLLTGTAAAALALSVPLVAPLLAGGPLDGLAAGVWLFVGGFSGVLLSPLHLCLALTREYFGASWAPIYRRIVPAVALIVAATVGLVLL